MPSSHVVNVRRQKLLLKRICYDSPNIGSWSLYCICEPPPASFHTRPVRSLPDVAFLRRFACAVSHQSTFQGAIRLLRTATLTHETHSVAELQVILAAIPHTTP